MKTSSVDLPFILPALEPVTLLSEITRSTIAFHMHLEKEYS